MLPQPSIFSVQLTLSSLVFSVFFLLNKSPVTATCNDDQQFLENYKWHSENLINFLANDAANLLVNVIWDEEV